MKTKSVFLVSKAERPAEDPLRRRIVCESRELFLRLGYAPVTTGEIARRLGISKATLYKHFATKGDLLKAVVRTIEAEILAGVEPIVADPSLDFLDKLVRLATHIGDWLSRVGRVLAGDLRRNAPEVWAEVDRFRREKILANFAGLLEAGVAEGVVRADIDRDLVLAMLLDLVQNFINPDALLENRRSAREVFGTLFRLVFEGILTGRARAALADRRFDPFGGFKEVPR
jgi:TetR/AcrR family transcriptional regulator, cholesterol catabolism regulator